jgi:dynein heavy chain 1
MLAAAPEYSALGQQDKSNSLVNSYKEISRIIEELSTCAYTYDAFAELIGKVQATVH